MDELMGEMDFSVFEHEFWMRRCLALAERGWGKVSPNPMVGAVLVRDGVVLAEGWHDVFGGAHAERMLFEGLALGGVLALGGGMKIFRIVFYMCRWSLVRISGRRHLVRI
jgi:hypothetical protein